MSRWVVAAVAVVMIQAAFLPALSGVYPFITIIFLLWASAHLSRMQLLGVTLGVGGLLDSMSGSVFGVYLLTYLGVWFLICCFREAGLEVRYLLGLTVAIGVIMGWVLLIDLVVAYIRTGSLIFILPTWIGTYILTIIFAFPFRSRLQLKV